MFQGFRKRFLCNIDIFGINLAKRINPFFHILKDARLRNCQQRKGHDPACLKRLRNLKGRVSQQGSFLQYTFLLYTTQAISYISENSDILKYVLPSYQIIRGRIQ